MKFPDIRNCFYCTSKRWSHPECACFRMGDLTDNYSIFIFDHRFIHGKSLSSTWTLWLSNALSQLSTATVHSPSAQCVSDQLLLACLMCQYIGEPPQIESPSHMYFIANKLESLYLACVWDESLLCLVTFHYSKDCMSNSVKLSVTSRLLWMLLA